MEDSTNSPSVSKRKESGASRPWLSGHFLNANDVTCEEWILLASQTVKGSGESWGTSGILTGSLNYLERAARELKQKKTKQNPQQDSNNKL